MNTINRKYIALLRGINVGGHNKLKMEALSSYCEELGWQNVQTYIQSGNIIFKAHGNDTQGLAESLAIKLKEKLGKLLQVLVIELSQLEDIYHHNPFILERYLPLDKLHVTFLGDEPNSEQKDTIQANQYYPDEFRIIGKAIYLYLPNGVADSKLANMPFDKKLKTIATARNWNTVSKLVEMATQE